jgi:flavodoxin/NAD-dependent dihydropyrimidine dehydrogenase PreA subunit
LKTAIVYYSLTGNTEKITEAIQFGIKQITGQCDIIKIKEANPKGLYDYDLIGFGAPVYGGKEPINVAAFIKDIRFLGGKQAFVYSTHCTMLFNFFPSIMPKLIEKGLTIIGIGDWFGSHFTPPTSESPYMTDGHPDEIEMKEAEAFGREIVERSKRIAAGETNLIPVVPPMKTPPEMKGTPHGTFAQLVKFEKEKCLYPACRLCMDNCPMDGFDLTVNPPIVAQPCLNCGFCEQICPTGAINAKEWLETPNDAIIRIHREFGIPNLKEAEAKGKFRWIVPEDKVGWDTPIYKLYPNHPRWIIGKGRP